MRRRSAATWSSCWDAPPEAGEVVEVEGPPVSILAVDEARIVESRFLAVVRQEAGESD